MTSDSPSASDSASLWRAVAAPRLLVLDEATANLDYASEIAVKAAVQSVRGGRTTLVVGTATR